MQLNSELVSIIIINWNGKKWLKKCLISLSEQVYINFEIIVVDNASEDDSVEFIKKYYPTTIVIRNEENYGFAKGNNIGISKAMGKYILLINNDTWIEKDFLEKLIGIYNKNDYDVISPREAIYNGDKRKPYVSRIDILGHPIYFFGNKYKNLQSFYLSGFCLFFAKELYEETKGFDDNFFMYCEEVDWFWRLNLLGKIYAYVDDIYVYHAGAGSTGGGIKYKTFLWRNQNTLQMILKNYSWVNLIWVLPAYFLVNFIEIIFFILIFKPRLAFSYFEGWLFNIKNFNKILAKRRWIQKNRIVDDFTIFKKMYIGFSKVNHLLGYLAHDKDEK